MYFRSTSVTSYSVSSVGANDSGCVKLRKIISYFFKALYGTKKSDSQKPRRVMKTGIMVTNKENCLGLSDYKEGKSNTKLRHSAASPLRKEKKGWAIRNLLPGSTIYFFKPSPEIEECLGNPHGTKHSKIQGLLECTGHQFSNYFTHTHCMRWVHFNFMLCFYKLVRKYFNSCQHTICFVFVKFLFCFVIVISSLVFHLLLPRLHPAFLCCHELAFPKPSPVGKEFSFLTLFF